MANKGPYVKISGVMKHAKKLYVNISGTMRQAVSTYIKVGGVWKETKVALNGSMKIGHIAAADSYYGFSAPDGIGNLSPATLGWNTVVSGIIARASVSGGSTRYRVSLSLSGANRLPMDAETTRSLVCTLLASDGANTSWTMTTPYASGPFFYWELGDGAKSLAIYNWLQARNGQAITVRGAFA